MLSVFAILCAAMTPVVVTQTTDLSVNSCTTLETEFSVLNGVPGGKAYVEGTTNSNCVLDLSGNASDILQLTFTSCGVTPTFLTSSNTLEFWVVVTETAYSNKNTDSRYHIRCLFQESTLNVDIQIEAETADKAGTEKKHNNIPQAVISLCRTQANGSCETVSYSNVVVMGETLKLRFDLEPQVPEYELRVDECFFEAKDKQTAVSVSSIDLLDPSTHCALYPIFPDFTNSNEQKISEAGNVFATPYAETTFEAFIPLTISRALALVNLDLVIGCKVSVCFRSSDCTLPTCNGARRKRNDDLGSLDHTGNTTKSWLYEGFRMQFLNEENNLQNPNDTVKPVKPGESDICLDKEAFWAIVLCLLLLLVGTFVGLCWFVLVTLQRRRHQQRKEYYVSTEITSSPTSTTSVSLPSSSSCEVPKLLPRFVPAAMSSFGRRSLTSA